MLFRIFTLHPEIFTSFFNQSLIARGLSNKIIKKEIINWREDFGIGNYKQVDDRPYGGGTGMVLKPEPIIQALEKYQALGKFSPTIQTEATEHHKLFANNSIFEDLVQASRSNQRIKSVTISLTPRGFRLNQKIVQWLAVNFQTLNIICGRYEGFDHRVDDYVDLELSLGDFILNGGEVASMALIESVSRLVPGFISKQTSFEHDSFSSHLNHYSEQEEFVIGKRKLQKIKSDQSKINPNTDTNSEQKTTKLFDNKIWQAQTLPYLEHPQYTRPAIFNYSKVPQVLIDGNHKLINQWRQSQ